MSPAQVLSTYLTLNLLVAVAFLVMKAFSEMGIHFGKVASGGRYCGFTTLCSL